MKRKSRTRKKLKAVSGDLYYEFLMIEQCAKGLNNELAGNSRILNNALLESFLIHARVLLHFFNPGDKTRPDDVIVSDFFSEPSDWEKVRDKLPVQSDFIEKFCKLVSKFVVHLSYERTNFRSKDLNWGNQGKKVYDYLSRAFRLFLETVPTDRLGQELRREKGILMSRRNNK